MVLLLYVHNAETNSHALTVLCFGGPHILDLFLLPVEMSLSERLEPGTRLLLLLNVDDASLTEAVALWPVSEGD